MRKKQRTEITIETARLLRLSKSSRSLFVWCDQCRAQVRMETPEEAAAAAGVSVRVIYAQVEAGELHFAETPVWPLLICLDSLLAETGITCRKKLCTSSLSSARQTEDQGRAFGVMFCSFPPLQAGGTKDAASPIDDTP